MTRFYKLLKLIPLLFQILITKSSIAFLELQGLIKTLALARRLKVNTEQFETNNKEIK